VGQPEAWRYDGRTAEELRAVLDLPRVEVHETVSSTQDVAHALGEAGAPAGTLVLADAQTAGRGRGARSWQSAPGAGIWLTLIERPRDATAMAVLSLRLALRLAPVLARWAPGEVRVKWPNDLLCGSRKLAGILTEVRWRGDRVEWVAIGIGINVRRPEGVDAAALDGVTDRADVLAELVPAVRAAASAESVLSARELERFALLDAVRNRRCRAPVEGVASGITADGALIIRTATGEQAVRSGSLVLEEQS
jgi:BirA family biotin operon repressor/biotin-[acetyl-CoA-carboxylase] ligase